MKFQDIPVHKYVQLAIDAPSASGTLHRAGSVIETGTKDWPLGRVRRLVMRKQAANLNDKEGQAAMKLGVAGASPQHQELEKAHKQLMAKYQQLEAAYQEAMGEGPGKAMEELQATVAALTEDKAGLEAELQDCQAKLAEAVNANKKAKA